MRLPAQCVSESFISTSFKLWSNARLGNSSEKGTIKLQGNNGSRSARAGVGSRLMRNKKEFGKWTKKAAHWNGKQSMRMHSLRNEHRMFLKQTCLISLKVWVGKLNEEKADCVTVSLFWPLLGPWKLTLRHFCDEKYVYKRVNGRCMTVSLRWFHEKYSYSVSIHSHISPIRIICLFTDKEYRHSKSLLLVVGFLDSGDYVPCWKLIIDTLSPLFFLPAFPFFFSFLSFLSSHPPSLFFSILLSSPALLSRFHFLRWWQKI